MNKNTILTLIFLSLCYFASISFSSGLDGNYAGAPADASCNSCHSPAAMGAGGGNVILTGVPNNFQPGVSYPITITISDPNAAVGGFQLVAINPTSGSNNQIGVFSTDDNGTRLTSTSRLTHKTPRAFNSGKVSWTTIWTAPMTSSAINNVSFYVSGNAANGNGDTSGDDVYNFSKINVALPVKLSSFISMQIDKQINLNWSTASEINSSHFEIERSIDGYVYTKIGSVNAAGNSNKNLDYTYVDRRPLIGVSQYRLKIVDIDGSVEYSDGLAQEYKSKEVGIYYAFNYLSIETGEQQFSTLRLVNTEGKVVYSENLSKNEFSIHRNLSQLKPSVYYLYLDNKFQKAIISL